MHARNPVKALGAFHAHDRALQSYLPLPSHFGDLHTFTHSTETTRFKKHIFDNIRTPQFTKNIKPQKTKMIKDKFLITRLVAEKTLHKRKKKTKTKTKIDSNKPHRSTRLSSLGLRLFFPLLLQVPKNENPLFEISISFIFPHFLSNQTE